MSLESVEGSWIMEWMTRNVIGTILCFGIVLSEVELIALLRRRSVFDTITSRKLTHALTGFIFILAWALFDSEYSARYYATLVPVAVTAKFVAIGLGWIEDKDTVNMVSRTGDRRELLKGPMMYGAVISAATFFSWRSLPALLSIIILCFGDGASGLLGPKYGRHKLPWNKTKSWEGSFAFFIFGLLGCFLCHFYAINLLWIPENPYLIIATATKTITNIALVVLGCTFVESLPIPEFDNITVFVSSIILSHALF